MDATQLAMGSYVDAEAAEEWHGVVARMPADWFPRRYTPTRVATTVRNAGSGRRPSETQG